MTFVEARGGGPWYTVAWSANSNADSKKHASNKSNSCFPRSRGVPKDNLGSRMFQDGIAVIGLGYIGLPTCAALAVRGTTVKGVDVNQDIVEGINAGRVTLVEPDLEALVQSAVQQGYLTATTEVPHANAFLIAVPTPFKSDYHPDLSYVMAATEAIAPMLRGGEVVILESTSPPGTTIQISHWLAELRPDLTFPHQDNFPDIHIAHCPERVLPGRIMTEIVTNDRIVGGITRRCAERAAEVYEIFCEGGILLTDASSAEMAKLVENSFRDVNIAFANELAAVCERIELDVWEVIKLANRHPRVNILKPGPGVGGHCIAVDPWFIVAAAPEESRIIRTAREVNDARPSRIVESVLKLAERFDHPAIACLGLAFKADVDDLRESPALSITASIAKQLPGSSIFAVEPHTNSLPPALRHLDNVTLLDVEDALFASEIIVLLVDHTEFRALSPMQWQEKQVIDTRGIWRR